MGRTHTVGSSRSQQANLYSSIIVGNSQRNQEIARFVTNLVVKEQSAPGVVFVRHRRHAHLLAQAISSELGRPVSQVSSKVARSERKALVEQLKTGLVPVVVATGVWDQGIDIPNLAWVLLAGEGQAPVGHKQKAGRPTRLDLDGLGQRLPSAKNETGYVIYDLRTMGSGSVALEEQAHRRVQHYADAGFSVGVTRLSKEEREGGPDVELLAALLETPAPGELEWRRVSRVQQDCRLRDAISDPRLLLSDDVRGENLLAAFVLNPKPWYFWVVLLAGFMIICYLCGIK